MSDKPRLSDTPSFSQTPKINRESVDKARKVFEQKKKNNLELLKTLQGYVSTLQDKRDSIVNNIREKNKSLTEIIGKQKEELQTYRDWFDNLK